MAKIGQESLKTEMTSCDEKDLDKGCQGPPKSNNNSKGKNTWIKDDCHNPRKSGHEISSSRLKLKG
jgi:hypothetical protein